MAKFNQIKSISMVYTAPKYRGQVNLYKFQAIKENLYIMQVTEADTLEE